MRSTLTRDQWDAWLQFARGERKRRNQIAAPPMAMEERHQMPGWLSAAITGGSQALREVERTLDNGWETCGPGRALDRTTAHPGGPFLMTDTNSIRSEPLVPPRRDRPCSSPLEGETSRPSSPSTRLAHVTERGRVLSDDSTDDITGSAAPQSTKPALATRAPSPLTTAKTPAGRGGHPAMASDTRHSNTYPSTSKPLTRALSPGPGGQSAAKYHQHPSMSRSMSLPTQKQQQTHTPAPSPPPSHTTREEKYHRTSLSRPPPPNQDTPSNHGRKSLSEKSSNTHMSQSGPSTRLSPPRRRSPSPSTRPPADTMESFPRTLQEVAQITFHPQPDVRSASVPRRPKGAPRLHHVTLGDKSAPTRSAIRSTSASSRLQEKNTDDAPSRGHFYPYCPTSEAEQAVGASPPHVPKRPHDYQNLSWHHKTATVEKQDDDPLRWSTSAPRSPQTGRATIGSSPPHSPRKPVDAKQPPMQKEWESIPRRVVPSERDRSPPSSTHAVHLPTSTPAATSASVQEGTFHVQADGSLRAVSAAAMMIQSEPAPRLDQFAPPSSSSPRGQKGHNASYDRSGGHTAPLHSNVSEGLRSLPPSSGHLPGASDRYEARHTPPRQVPPSRKEDEAEKAFLARYGEQSRREEQKWADHLQKQEHVRQEQTKQWAREEDDWIVQRQIEKQRTATHPSQPPTEAGAIVKASALRIDSAYAAAQCLKASLEADMSDPQAAERYRICPFFIGNDVIFFVTGLLQHLAW